MQMKMKINRIGEAARQIVNKIERSEAVSMSRFVYRISFFPSLCISILLFLGLMDGFNSPSYFQNFVLSWFGANLIVMNMLNIMFKQIVSEAEKFEQVEQVEHQ